MRASSVILTKFSRCTAMGKSSSHSLSKVTSLVRFATTTLLAITLTQPIQGFHPLHHSVKSSFLPITRTLSLPRQSYQQQRHSSSQQQHRHQQSVIVIEMCQLLGMNSATPMDFYQHFHGFRQRGGRTDVHSHGWGLAFYEGPCGVRCFHDTQPAATSAMAHFIAHCPIHTYNMMAHIRYATQGQVDLANVHPFQRELWGIPWTFCHNGDVPLAADSMPVLGQSSYDGSKSQSSSSSHQKNNNDNNIYHPIGQTDSERIFCAMLNALRARFQTLPTLPVLYDAIAELCHEIVSHDPANTIFNCLLACGPHVLWAYSWPGQRPGSRVWNGLHYITKQAPFLPTSLRDVDCTVDLTSQSNSNCSSSSSSKTQDNDNNNNHRVSFIATKPLTYEDEWVEFKRGQLIVFDQGLPHMGASSLYPVELDGRGLLSHVLPKSPLDYAISQSTRAAASATTATTTMLSRAATAAAVFSGDGI